MFKNYFNSAIRNLWKNKVFSLINVIGLSIGLACCMIIFLYAKDELSYDRFHQYAKNIYHLTTHSVSPDGHVNKYSSTGVMPGPHFTRAIPDITDFVRIQGSNYTVKLGTQVFDQDVLRADSNFFSFFSFPLLEGNPRTTLREPRSVVLSEEVAEKYFGKKKALGALLELKVNDTFQTFTVSAIARKSPQNSTIKIKMLLPFFVYGAHRDDQWFNFFLNTFISLKPGSNAQKVESKMAQVYDRESATQAKEMAVKYGMKDKIHYGLQPLLQMHTSTDFPADNGLTDASNPMYSYILSGIALFVLLIACINFINLTVARSLARAKEIGIRKVVGSQRRQLIIQFLGESFILTLIAFALALFLVITILPFFNSLANKALAFSYLFDAKLVVGYVTLLLLTAFLAGFYPALVLSGFNPVESLYNRQRFTGKNYLSKGLVVLQFTLATFLIIATLTIYFQFEYLMHTDLGYNDRNVAVVKAGELDEKKMNLLRLELLKNPSISDITADQGGRWGTTAYINGSQLVEFEIKRVDEHYLPLFDIPVLKGRNFSKDLVSDSAESVVVNEAFVKHAGWKEPIGQTVDFFYNNKKYRVIGVIKDYHYASLTEEIKPMLLTMNPAMPIGDVFIRLSNRGVADQLNYIEKTFKGLFPFKPYEYAFKDAQNAEQYDREAKWKQIITFGALLTIFISCIGLFGLSTLSAERRKKEIGIRKVLGASVQGIVSKLSNDFLKLVVAAAVIASPMAWWAMHRWLENYPYRIKMGYGIFLAAAVVVMLIALATVIFQSIKVAVENPVKSLRTE